MKVIQRLIWPSLAIVFLLLGASANAGEQAYEQKSFESAIKAGGPVAVEFSADWCPTCRAQKPVLQSLLKEESMKGLTLFVADFDKEDKLKRELRVSQQSTIVVFKQGKEVGRSTGQTRRESLEALLRLAL